MDRIFQPCCAFRFRGRKDRPFSTNEVEVNAVTISNKQSFDIRLILESKSNHFGEDQSFRSRVSSDHHRANQSPPQFTSENEDVWRARVSICDCLANDFEA